MSHFSYLHYIYQNSSTQELSTLQDMQERKKKTYYMILSYIQEASYTQNGK